VISKKGAWYYLQDEKIGQGRDNTKEFLLKNVDLFEKIKSQALDNNLAIQVIKN
jgi:recombination protein RecA